ncbi:MAG: tRNA (N6-threonylcarbamoyladenosine(37)-N6)-methyltransferase TrmO [Anaerolineales bacterium]|nr:tRNA (N6-threonylcarbamoyladenosine(37)-N6)-methyltransferase TrmO [Anaerolineales bacterium]
MSNKKYDLQSIGTIQRPESGIMLQIAEPFRPGLKQLEHFSHVIVLWWADQEDNDEGRSVVQVRPPYAEDHLTGIFATRSPQRPNPIGMTTCEISRVDEENGIVHIVNIDAFENTPIIDLKGYFPVCDRVKDAHIPDWLDWGIEWLPDEGMGFFEEYEEA